jgi:hypothetical protein
MPSNEFAGSAQRGYPVFEDISPKMPTAKVDKNTLPTIGTYGRKPFDLLTLINSKTGD